MPPLGVVVTAPPLRWPAAPSFGMRRDARWRPGCGRGRRQHVTEAPEWRRARIVRRPKKGAVPCRASSPSVQRPAVRSAGSVGDTVQKAEVRSARCRLRDGAA
eukprot:scaffold1421_cov293-Prasinococcus_capsulatus_cf.AAC.7